MYNEDIRTGSLLIWVSITFSPRKEDGLRGNRWAGREAAKQALWKIVNHGNHYQGDHGEGTSYRGAVLAQAKEEDS